MPYTYNKLRGRIIEKYGSQTKFAKEIGISQQALSRKMNCKIGFSQEDIVLWGHLLDISPTEYSVYFFA